ncbi:hypothetical protein EUGRSUZ_C02973 [Eucalyptus grandis]|uniref:Bet v I/Major latex protein domain-containing protein n=3 Tax=Eucalyptus grandis TaxID=71139 RepID=A0A059CT99_EUCGR|nr:hypothetical protein EUGRSUZ_C02955 [Eucalyptus grandis]KAK3438352.1 hypothetical protein EUGRSUZ_C02973 [Eucalyptus grandis]
MERQDQLKELTPDEVWPLLEDFCNLHKLLPPLDTCHRVEGINLAPVNGLHHDQRRLRPVEDPVGHERLLMMDPSEKCFSYEVLDNNIGLKSYVATIKVMPMNDGDGKMVGYMIEWSFVADPVEDWAVQDKRSFVDFFYQYFYISNLFRKLHGK